MGYEYERYLERLNNEELYGLCVKLLREKKCPDPEHKYCGLRDSCTTCKLYAVYNQPITIFTKGIEL